jgi:hypothetical protein
LGDRPVDVSIEETLCWAVETILCELCRHFKVNEPRRADSKALET